MAVTQSITQAGIEGSKKFNPRSNHLALKFFCKFAKLKLAGGGQVVKNEKLATCLSPFISTPSFQSSRSEIEFQIWKASPAESTQRWQRGWGKLGVTRIWVSPTSPIICCSFAFKYFQTTVVKAFSTYYCLYFLSKVVGTWIKTMIYCKNTS